MLPDRRLESDERGGKGGRGARRIGASGPGSGCTGGGILRWAGALSGSARRTLRVRRGKARTRLGEALLDVGLGEGAGHKELAIVAAEAQQLRPPAVCVRARACALQDCVLHVDLDADDTRAPHGTLGLVKRFQQEGGPCCLQLSSRSKFSQLRLAIRSSRFSPARMGFTCLRSQAPLQMYKGTCELLCANFTFLLKILRDCIRFGSLLCCCDTLPARVLYDSNNKNREATYDDLPFEHLLAVEQILKTKLRKSAKFDQVCIRQRPNSFALDVRECEIFNYSLPQEIFFKVNCD